MAYANMTKIYEETPTIVYNMAVSYLLDKGFRYVGQITDEDIENLEENGLMTKEFVQDLVRTARNIARECGNNALELIQFCQKKRVFDTKFYK